MILACTPVLPVTAIYKNSLYMILACVAKCRSSAWNICTFSGQERPTQKELRGRSRLSASIWFWLVRLAVLPVTAVYRTAYTWFWLVWPNAGLTHELLVHFLARKGQHKNSYMDVLVFLRQYDSGLCICSTSDSNVHENPIHDSGLRGQMVVLCMNYWYIFWPGKANKKKSYMNVLVFLPQYDSGLCACSTSDSYI